MFWSVLSGVLVATALTGVALGAALGLTGLVLLYCFANGATSLAVLASWNAFNSFTLSAIPLFILLGEVLLHSGVGQRAYAAFSPVFARVPGGLLHTNIVVCTIFGAVSGSSMSTAAAVGSVAYPEMVRRGYRKESIVGSLAGGGTLGLLIPPSLALLIYGALTDTSIGKLFLAGILPGLLVATLFMAWILFASLRDPSIAPREADRPALRAVLRGTLAVWPVLILIGAIMGSIAFGWATATESASVGVVVAVAIAFIWGDLTLPKLIESVLRSALLFAAIGFVVLGASILAQATSIIGVPQALLETTLAAGLGRYEVLVLVVLFYFALGCFFDGLSLMVMTLPIVFPVIEQLGFDPVWFGVIVTLMIEASQLTPPVGLNLSILTAVTQGEIGLGRAARAAIPYWIMLFAAVLLLVLFPGVATLLPALVAD